MVQAPLSSWVGEQVTPSRAELEELFRQKHGRLEVLGWAPRRRLRFHYFLPGDIYEATVSKHVTPHCSWLDVGGGHAIFPENPELARALVSRCTRVVAVDPSPNVHENTFVHERVQSTVENFKPESCFDLVTMRMVVEHVEHPKLFVEALSRLVRPGGTAIVFTVNLRSPITRLSRYLPFRFHHAIKRRFWGGVEEDTFPVHYRMNTREVLGRLFEHAGFVERAFVRLDDLSAFGLFKLLNYVELLVWRGLRQVGLQYPENCLLGLYTKRIPS